MPELPEVETVARDLRPSRTTAERAVRTDPDDASLVTAVIAVADAPTPEGLAKAVSEVYPLRGQLSYQLCALRVEHRVF